MFRVIKVYGKLAKHLGQRSFKAAVKTPAEAIRFLLANFPSLRGVMSEGDYQISVGRNQLEVGSHPEQLHYPSASFEAIRVVPVVAGAGATGRIIAGVALFAVATLATAGGGAIFGAAFAKNVGFLAATQAVGVSLALGGVAQLLTPTPQLRGMRDSEDASDPRRSFSFSGIQNVSRQGVPVPIIYGEVFTGSVVISAGINTEEIPT